MKQKRLTLEETWTRCLKMWRWIVKRRGKDSIGFLKRRYLDAHEDADFVLVSDCYFCDYAEKREGEVIGRCDHCPGRRVDPGFHCQNDSYDFRTQPLKFLRKLERLNRIRKAKKGSKNEKNARRNRA